MLAAEALREEIGQEIDQEIGAELDQVRRTAQLVTGWGPYLGRLPSVHCMNVEPRLLRFKRKNLQP